METENELRTRLAGVDTNDLTAVHALYLDMKQFLNTGQRGVATTLSLQGLARRVERAEGLAIRAAQARGEVMRQNQSGDSSGMTSVKEYVTSSGESTMLYSVVDGVTEDMFEQAMAIAWRKKRLGRTFLIGIIEELKAQEPAAPPPPPAPVAKTVVVTRRGRKTIEHMAISINAIAMGVSDLDPREVPTDMSAVIAQVFEDIGIVRTFLRKVNKNAGQ